MGKAAVNHPPTEEEWQIITFIEEQFYKNHELPDIDTLADEFDVEPNRAREFFANKTITTVLENRGVPVDSSSTAKHFLSPKQLAAANAYLNFTDSRPLDRKLRELHVSQAQFYGWLKQKRFRDYLRQNSEDDLESTIALAHRELNAKAARGDIKAIKLLYEITGRHTGILSSETGNVRRVLMQIIEIIEKHIKDPDTLQHIAKDFEALFIETNTPVPVEASNPSKQKLARAAILPVGTEEAMEIANQIASDQIDMSM